MKHVSHLLRNLLRSGRVRCCLSTTVLLLAVVTEAHAAEKFWGNFIGGAYNAGANWQGGSVAGASDVAHFGLSFNIFFRTYTVDFDVSPTNRALVIEDDNVTFDLNGRIYTTTDSLLAIDIGTVAGKSDRLTITDGIMIVDFASQLRIGVGGSGFLRSRRGAC